MSIVSFNLLSDVGCDEHVGAFSEIFAQAECLGDCVTPDLAKLVLVHSTACSSKPYSHVQLHCSAQSRILPV
jgi:hypothetical protein